MNEHIEDYCRKFIGSKENPHYAVFLNGKWGTGKTYFINKLLEEYKDDTNVKSKDIIKISLFGVKSTDEIDMKIYQAIHPILSSKTVKLFGAVVKSAIKLGTTIDLNGDNKDDISLSSDGLFELKSGDKVNSISKKLIIVDDFERAILTPNQIFGYFSEIITESDTRIIFIGNEESIYDKDEMKKKEYLRIKEKTIGVEFELEPNKKNAINSFLSELSLQEKEFFSAKIFEISEVLNCENLRTIWQALYNLNIFVSLIGDILEDNDKDDIFEIFLILYIQKNLEEIHKGDNINSILTGYYKHQKSYKKYTEWLNEQQNQNKDSYFFPSFLSHIPFLDAWNKLIFEGYYNKEWLISIYKKEKKELEELSKPKKISNLFNIVNNWRSLSRKEFEPLIKKVKDDFNSGKYKHPGEILLYCSYMLIFSHWKLIPDSKETIKTDFEILLNSQNNDIIPLYDWGSIEFGYGGYGFSNDFPEFVEIKKNLKDFNQRNIRYHSQKDIENDINSLNSDIDLFIKNISHVNGNMKYYKQPILSYICIDDFYKKLITLPIAQQQQIIGALAERYGKVYGNEPFEAEYAPDLENLKTLNNLYQSNKSDVTYNPQKLFEQTMINDLNELVLYVERKVEQLNTNNSRYGL